MYTLETLNRAYDLVDSADTCDLVDILKRADEMARCRIEDYLVRCHGGGEDFEGGYYLELDAMDVAAVALDEWERPGIYTLRTFDGDVTDFKFSCDTPEQLASSIYMALCSKRHGDLHVRLDDVWCWASVA